MRLVWVHLFCRPFVLRDMLDKEVYGDFLSTELACLFNEVFIFLTEGILFSQHGEVILNGHYISYSPVESML